MMSRYILQHFRRILPLQRMACLFLLSIVAVAAGSTAFEAASREFVVLDGQQTLAVSTLGRSVQQVLKQLEVTVGSEDYISVPLGTTLDPEELNTLLIKRAVPVSLTADGETRNLLTWRSTVGELLKEQDIELGELDRMAGLTKYTPIRENLAIRVIRVRVEKVSEFEATPYNVIEVPDHALNEGETRVTQTGIDGENESVFEIIYEDGRPISRTFLEERVVSLPTERIVTYGTVKNFRNSRGDVVRYTEALDFRATAYTASYEDTGKRPGEFGFGITKSGIRAREGVIAVDPRVIPLGTRVYVEVPGPAPDYGFAIAADIGSAIRGNLIDLYFDTSQKAIQWGRRNVRVYILNEQNDSRWKQNDNPWAR